MKITANTQENAFGNSVSYKSYETASKNCVLCFHGYGELGPVEGTTLDLVERHGYPKHAKAGFEFPFNLIAIQAQPTSKYSQIRKFFPAYIKLKYGFENIFATGLSLGGFCTFDIALFDSLKIVSAIAPVCGGISKNLASTYPSIHGWAFHGDKDTTVQYSQSKNFVDEYNKTHLPDFAYTLYPGVGHDAWNKAYSVTPGQDELLQWFIQKFNEAPKSTEPVDWKTKLINFINIL